MKKVSIALLLAVLMSLAGASLAYANITDADRVSVGELESNIFTQFDASRNGVIDADEDRHRNCPFTIDLSGADFNADGVVDKDELEACIAQFDTDNDGHLDEAELAEFEAATGEGARTGSNCQQEEGVDENGNEVYYHGMSYRGGLHAGQLKNGQ